MAPIFSLLTFATGTLAALSIQAIFTDNTKAEIKNTRDYEGLTPAEITLALPADNTWVIKYDANRTIKSIRDPNIDASGAFKPNGVDIYGGTVACTGRYYDAQNDMLMAINDLIGWCNVSSVTGSSGEQWTYGDVTVAAVCNMSPNMQGCPMAEIMNAYNVVNSGPPWCDLLESGWWYKAIG